MARPNRGELRREVAVALGIFDLRVDLPAVLLEALAEGVSQPDAVVAAGID